MYESKKEHKSTNAKDKKKKKGFFFKWKLSMKAYNYREYGLGDSKAQEELNELMGYSEEDAALIFGTSKSEATQPQIKVEFSDLNEIELKFKNADIEFYVAGTKFRVTEAEKIVSEYYEIFKKEGISKSMIFENYDREDPYRQIFKYPMLTTTDVKLEAEPDNIYDKNAVKVMVKDILVGYVPKKYNKEFIGELENYSEFAAYFSKGTYKDKYLKDEEYAEDDARFKIIIEGIKINK